MFVDGDRNGCALHGALHLLEAIDGVVPIVHGSMGCGVAAWSGHDGSAGQPGELSAHAREVAATGLQEKQVVFGGTARLREQIKNAVKVMEGELYVVLSGCVPEIVGDDVPAMVKEAREQRFPVIGIASPGFRGHGWLGYSSAASALLEQLPELPGAPAERVADVNLLGVAPGLDAAWEGDLAELELALAELGLRTNRLIGLGHGVQSWRSAAHARLSVVLSPWGVAPARVLQERHGVPILDLGWLPTGSRDTGALLRQAGEMLAIDRARIELAEHALDRRLRYVLSRAAAAVLLGDVQKRAAVVGGTAGAVGQARYLAGTLGLLVEAVLVTDEPPEDARPAIVDAVRSGAGGNVEVAFLQGQNDITRALQALKPELIVGSGIESLVAAECHAALVETATPIRRRPVWGRSHAGVGGAITLLEEVVAAAVGRGCAHGTSSRFRNHAISQQESSS